MAGLCTPSRVGAILNCGDCHERPHLRQSGNLETADFEGGVKVWPPGDDSPLGADATWRADSKWQQQPQQQGMDDLRSPPVVSPEAVKVVEAHSPSKEKPRQQSMHHSICGGPLLDEDETMRNASWCFYCCCGGCASSCTQCRPLQCAMETLCCTNVCFSAACTDEDNGGPCKLISDCLCCTALCQAPPRSGRPWCVLCNRPCCGAYHTVGRPEPDKHGRDADFDRALDEGCVPCFCCTCCGMVLGLTAISQHVWKLGCFECKQKVAYRGGFRLCGSLCSCICCLGQMRLPCYPTPPSPCVALCCHRCRKPGGYAANWARFKHKHQPVATKTIVKMNFDSRSHAVAVAAQAPRQMDDIAE